MYLHVRNRDNIAVESGIHLDSEDEACSLRRILENIIIPINIKSMWWSNTVEQYGGAIRRSFHCDSLDILLHVV